MFLKCISIKFPQPSFDLKDVQEIRGDGSYLTAVTDLAVTVIPLSDYRVIVSLEPFGLSLLVRGGDQR